MVKSETKHKPKVQKRPDFAPGMAPKMLAMLQSIEDLEQIMNKLTANPHHEVFERFSSLDKSKLGLLEAYAVNSLFWVLMKTSTETVEKALQDDFKLEMGRIKEVQSRISELEARPQRQRIDRAAAGRFIRQGIGAPTRNEGEAEDADVSLVKEECMEYDEEEYDSEENVLVIPTKPLTTENKKFAAAWQ